MGTRDMTTESKAAFLERFNYHTRAQGVRAANRELTLLEGVTEQQARESIETALATPPPGTWGDEFTAGVQATFREALSIIEAHRVKRERAERDALEAREKAARAIRYAEQREADAARPLPKLYDARFK